MAELYADLCTFLAKAETGLLCGEGQRMQEIDMKKLLSDSKEHFYLDIKRQLVDYIGSFRPGTPTRRDVFFSTLYTALVLTSQAEDSLLRKKMLIKTYSWLLTNKSRAGRSDHRESAPAKLPTTKQKEPSPPKQRPLRPDMAFVRPKSPAVPLNPSLSQKLDEYRQAQMKSMRDLVESRQAIRSWSRAKSRAEERSVYLQGVKAAAKPKDTDTRSRLRPPTVVNCKRPYKNVYSIPDIRPKSKLERARLRAERLFQFEEVPRITEMPDLSETLHAQEERLLQEVSVLKYRLSETCTAVSYKTLASGLVPPRPPLSRLLPKGGELLTSNPFWRFQAEKPVRVSSLKLLSDTKTAT